MLDSNVFTAAPCAGLRNVKSLNETTIWSSYGEEENVELQDIVADDRPNQEDQFFCSEIKTLIKAVYKTLPPSLKRIAVYYFIKNQDKAEVARSLGVSRSAVTQGVNKISEKLKATILAEMDYKV